MKFYKITEADLSVTLTFLSRAQLSNVTWADLNGLMTRLKASEVIEEAEKSIEKPKEKTDKKSD